MKTRAALLWGIGEDWEVDDIELDDPGPGEVLVKMRAAGMCHSDEHAVTGDLPMPFFPLIGGHEGAGEVLAVGPAVTRFAVGDHVAMSFIPSCGECHWCSSGQALLCDLGIKLFDLGMISDGAVRHHCGEHDVARMSQLGTFAEHLLVSQDSLVKVDADLPWHAVALVSCGVATGFGSAVNRAEVKPGETVAVIGVGGVGINAVQGARVAGAGRIIAIDPVEFKREQAGDFGATHTYASVEEAAAAVAELTWGVMCDKVIVTPGVVPGELIEASLQLTRKGGTCVLTGLGRMGDTRVSMDMSMLTLMNKEVKGCLFGSGNPRVEIPNLLSLYRSG
ncbi:MAG: NDMA-dependent alcohol dehydrogenase, partial [Acidimicrobiales bacterium]|nr:NDMA-dependent alcohol dehydrogenase [Acidimicrobiales bacterium]